MQQCVWRTFLIAAVTLCGATACGGGGGSAAPLIGTTSFTANENTAVQGQLSSTDSATVTYKQSTNPTSGTLTSFSPSGAFVYQPGPNFTGTDSFQVTATDSSGRMSTATITITIHVNHPPVAANDILRADGSALESINVLANDTDADGDHLTVTIEQAPLVGTATVNSDGTISLTALPSSFKGLTRFQYRITDPSGASAVATAAIFVGIAPFRATFVGDAAGNGSREVYLTDFAADPQAISAATQGTLRLGGYAASDNGATVVYRSKDTASAAASTLYFVKTAAPSQQVAIPLPSGAAPAQSVSACDAFQVSQAVVNGSGCDEFSVSPDGQWIAAIAAQGSTQTLYVVNVSMPAAVSQVVPAGALYVTTPRFSTDSKTIYFLATSLPSGANKSLYLAGLSNPTTTVAVSATSAPGGSDDVSDYAVSADQTRILLQATRGGIQGLYFVDPTHLQTELLVNQVGQTVLASTISLPPGRGGSATNARVAYTDSTATVYVAEVSAAPNPRVVASGHVLGLRPDDATVLYWRFTNVYESTIDSANSEQLVGGGGNGWYDSTGNIVLLHQSLPSGPALASTFRGSFGTTQAVGTGGLVANYTNVSGFDRAVALLGESPGSSPPASVHLALVNALAPSDLFYLADFQTPLGLTSDVAKIVTP